MLQGVNRGLQALEGKGFYIARFFLHLYPLSLKKKIPQNPKKQKTFIKAHLYLLRLKYVRGLITSCKQACNKILLNVIRLTCSTFVQQ